MLVQACSLKHLLGLGPWLQQLLLMAADAAAAGDSRQAAMGLEVFAVCLKQLPDMQVLKHSLHHLKSDKGTRWLILPSRYAICRRRHWQAAGQYCNFL